MRKVRYWLLLNIARMPKAFTYGAGILTAFALIMATMVSTAWVDRNRIAQRHDGAMRIFQALSAESTGLLGQLVQHGVPDCDKEALMYFNTGLLQSRYLREVGVLDDGLRLVCSTALGRLREPIKGNYPVHVSLTGLELLNGVPLTMAGRKLSAVIIQRPPFNVVVSPYATGDVYASADAVWLRTADGLVLLNANANQDDIAGMRERAGRHENADVAPRGLGYELITTAPGTDLVLQTRRGIDMIVRENGLLLSALLAGSLLIAMLAAGTITPYVIRLCGLRNRIGHLCDESHLALVYQPVFDLDTLRPVGCEVLARLTEDGRFWMPDKIIPAILEAGLESRFDHAIAGKAVRELAAHLPAWSGKFTIALNCFPASVEPDALVPVLKDALQAGGRHDLDICIEITEHSLSCGLITEVQRLKAHGFLIAVDDFGTGYSNLKSVTSLSPDLLKIDRSFVHELEDATLRSNLVPEIVNIARAVNAQTVAEGIEKPEQVRLLKAAGVRYGQGYALARPMEMAPFIAFMNGFK